MSKNPSMTAAVAASLTTGDARRMVLQTMADLQSGHMDVDRGMAIAANMRALNDSLIAEVHVVKLQMVLKHEDPSFGQVAPLGQRVLGK
jgi:hypothetical protein